ncbi:MAG: hypothetical protein AVDCRST_MAG12-1817, partial [uncultured Rubrobacteraceae bacterium]
AGSHRSSQARGGGPGDRPRGPLRADPRWRVRRAVARRRPL